MSNPGAKVTVRAEEEHAFFLRLVNRVNRLNQALAEGATTPKVILAKELMLVVEAGIGYLREEFVQELFLILHAAVRRRASRCPECGTPQAVVGGGPSSSRCRTCVREGL